MWKRYLAIFMALVLMLHAIPVKVYAEESADFVQNDTVDAESEEKSESEEETGNPKEEPDAGIESERPGQEEPGENTGEESGKHEEDVEQPEEITEEESKQLGEDVEQEQPGENMETEQEQPGENMETETEQPGEDSGQEEREEKNGENEITEDMDSIDSGEERTKAESDILPVVDVAGTAGEYQPEGASYKLTYAEVAGGVKITGITGMKEGELKIPGKIGGMDVVEIGDRAFSGCNDLHGELKIPESVTKIGMMAFYDCSGFSGKLVIPDGLCMIPDYAFEGCNGISEVRIHENMEQLGSGAFSHGSAKRKIYVYNRNLIIGNGFGDYNIIYGYSGSTTEDYVNHNGLQNVFIALDNSPEIQEYHVKNTEELLAAIGSNRRVILADGMYDLGWNYFGIHDQINLSIEAEHPGKAEVLSREKTRPVIEINSSVGISISGCILGHESVEKGDQCGDHGYVIEVWNSTDIKIANCDLYGCGIWGVSTVNSAITIEDSVIRDCMEGIVKDGKDDNVYLQNCILSGNAYDEKWEEHPAFLCNCVLAANDCIFINNHNRTLVSDNNNVSIENCSFYNNVWDGGTPQPSGVCLNGITWQVNDDVLKLGFPLELDNGTIQSKTGKVLDYSESSSPWKNCDFRKVQYAEGIEKPDQDIINGGSEPVPGPGEGEDNIAEGEYQNIKWFIDPNGKLTVTGEGEFAPTVPASAYYDSKYSNRAPWYDYRDQVKSAEIYVEYLYDASWMFYGCSNMESVDLSNFDTERTGNMYAMFSGCSSIRSIDLSGIGTQSVRYMGHMFQGCSSLAKLDLRNFDTSQVTNMAAMFDGCSSLVKLDLTSFDTSLVSDMSWMFSNCRSLADVDLRGFETGQLMYMAAMFNGCSSLSELDLSGFDGSLLRDMEDNAVLGDESTIIFDNCGKLCTLYTPHDLRGYYQLPAASGDVWYQPDGTEITKLPTGCASVVIARNKMPEVNKPYIQVIMRKTNYVCGDFIAISGLTVKYYGSDGSVRKVTDYTTNADEIDMSASGKKTLIVTYNGLSAEVELTVSAVTVKKIELDKTKLTLKTGETARLTAKVSPENAVDYEIVWASSNTSVAKVENGLVMAVSKGECTITAMAGDKSARCDVVVDAHQSGDIDPSKQIVHISGIKPKNKVYDGSPYSYIGTAVLLDSTGKQIQGVSLVYSYSGTYFDGSVYAETKIAPSQAGSYTLAFKLSGNDADKYELIRSSYNFSIIRKEITITAESLEIEVGDQLPKISDLKYTVDGLIGNEELSRSPSLKYSQENISTAKEGKYEIIPYDADEGNNYRIKYVNGILLVGDYGEIPVEDIPNGGVIPEGLWIAGLMEDGYDYTGKAIKPQVRVYDYKTLLREKKDYTVSYARNTKAYGYDSWDEEFDAKKAPTITVTAKRNYSGKETVNFKIRPLDICGEGFFADDMAVKYKASGVQKPMPVLIWNGKKLKNKTDYTVTYYDSKEKELDAVKETGQYYIVMNGRGNFCGNLWINLTVTDRLKMISKVSVAGIKSQSYTGDSIMPALTVKDGRTELTEDVHYVVSYSQNTEVGTAYAVIMGINEEGYCGSKRISFKITGTPIKKASVTGLTEQKFVYEGVDITPRIQLGMKTNATGAAENLISGTDYTVSWQKNHDAGTATVLFTGKGAYTGTLKKTFKIGKFDIAANADGRFEAVLDQLVIPYAKGGAKPEVIVRFRDRNGSLQTLKEGQDYTLSYRNHTAVNDGSNMDKKPTVIVKGKGNFSGTFGTELNYQIKAQDLGQLAIMAQDKTFRNRRNIYATKVSVTDLDGKVLKAGTDYEKTLAYTYKNETTVVDAADYRTVVRAVGEAVDKNDIIPAGTVLNVRVDAKAGGNYEGSLSGEYRMTHAAISSASVSIPKQTYTGQAIVLDKSQITVRMKGEIIGQDQYEIVPNSYKNNVKKGTASVTIRGADNYGGTKTVKFNIRAKGFVWWK